VPVTALSEVHGALEDAYDVRFGSFSDFGAGAGDVSFAPKNGHWRRSWFMSASVERNSVCCLPGHSYFWALEKAVSSTSPIGCHVRPSN
jgi:hypothetical protein